MPAWKHSVIILAGLGLAALVGQAVAQGAAPPGQAIFADNCADCHRTNGEGLPPTFPALKGSPLVLGEPAPLIDTVLQGRKGLSTMPAWKGTLSEKQIALVLTYIRAAWGNQARPVTPEQVKARLK